VDIALGFRPHTGWTVAVAIGGQLASPRVVERRMLALTDEDQVPGQVYHAAVGLEPAAAEALVRRAEEIVAKITAQEVAQFITDLRSAGHLPVVAGVATSAVGSEGTGGAGRGPPPDVVSVLAAHPRMHAAEGELYGEALVDALDDAGVPVTRVHPRELAAFAGRRLRRAVSDLQRSVTALGVPLGPPWRKDEKEATLLAWVALADRVVDRA
jgi:hypothetical protein